MRRSEQMKQRVLEMNASGDYRISAVRNKIKSFAQLAVPATAKTRYKLIILDEADAMGQVRALARSHNAHALALRCSTV
jgi:DNA polymerase III delta prime subunit